MSKVGILTLPGANVHAVSYWAKRCGVEASLVSRPEHVSGLDFLILPGVGAFDTAMAYLDQTGLRQAVVAHAKSGGYLAGICLGMQIMFESSEEGNAAGLGLLEGRVRRIPGGVDRVPNIGWRPVACAGEGRPQPDPTFFFMHSYGMPASEFAAADACLTLETVECNVPLVAAFRRQNLMGFQYHPEKSYTAGDRLLSEILHEIQSHR
jgi:glutamine amidotransferase